MRTGGRWLPWMLLAVAAASGIAASVEQPQSAGRPENSAATEKAGKAATDAQDKKDETDQKDEKDEKDEKEERDAEAKALSLTSSQREAVGLKIEHPLPLTTAPQIEAYGTVLDPVALVTEMGRMESSRVAAAAAAADAARLERLYRDDTQASLKAVQAAQAQSVEADAQARAAALSFRLQWGPVAAWSPAQRRALLDAVTQGQLLLLRADVLGQRVNGAMDRNAIVEVDGLNIAARVLGPLPRAAAGSQSVGWLLQLERHPEALGPGVHAAVVLRATATTGMLVPGSALLYSEQGIYVYRERHEDGADAFHYEPATVRPLTRVGSAWLVAGLERSDRVVVEGAGVLWSLQGLGTFSAAEEEHD
jgi:hypothetical protein